MNVYNKVINRKYTYLEAYTKRRRAIKDISWDRIIIKRIILINDFNVYSLKQNSIYENLIRARPLEALLIKFNSIIINGKGMLIKRLLEKIFIIDLAIISPNIGDIMT